MERKQVKCITSHNYYSDLESEVNRWLSENSNKTVIDIKFVTLNTAYIIYLDKYSTNAENDALETKE